MVTFAIRISVPDEYRDQLKTILEWLYHKVHGLYGDELEWDIKEETLQ